MTMILPLMLAPQPSPGAPTLLSALTHLGSSELFLLKLQGELEVSSEQHGQLVSQLMMDDDGKVHVTQIPLFSLVTTNTTCIHDNHRAS